MLCMILVEVRLNVFDMGKVIMSQLLCVFDSDEFRQRSQNQPNIGDKLCRCDRYSFLVCKTSVILVPA